LVAFGISWSVSLTIRKKYWAAAVVAVLTCLVPSVYMLAQAWSTTVPFLVVGMGAAGLFRAFYLRHETEGTN
jgi:hypothetical protein